MRPPDPDATPRPDRHDTQEDNVSKETEAAATLGAVGLTAYRMTLVGHAAPLVDAYRERITHPQIGDLVVEVSSFRQREARGEAHEAVGTLVGWDDDLALVEPYMGGAPVTWGNAEFVSIPRTSVEAREWQTIPDEASR